MVSVTVTVCPGCSTAYLGETDRMPLSTIMCCLSSIAVGSPVAGDAGNEIWGHVAPMRGTHVLFDRGGLTLVGPLLDLELRFRRVPQLELGRHPTDVLQQQRDHGVGAALDRGR